MFYRNKYFYVSVGKYNGYLRCTSNHQGICWTKMEPLLSERMGLTKYWPKHRSLWTVLTFGYRFRQLKGAK